MTDLIFQIITAILWFLLGSPTAAFTTVALATSAVLFHKSGAGRYTYPFCLRGIWWLLSAGARLAWRITTTISNKVARLWKSNFGAKPANVSQTINTSIAVPQRAVAVEQLSTGDDWVMRTLKSMGFSAAEARAATGTPEVAAESTLDEQVRAALVNLNPLRGN